MPGSRRARPPVRVLVFGVALGAGLAPSSEASAGEGIAEPIAIAYAAADGCPSEAEFLASTRRYTGKWTAVGSDTDGIRSFEIRLARRAREHAGTLVIRGADGRASTREIVGPDCASVARGLAVVVALAIDPKAHIGEAPSDAEPDVASAPVVTSEPVESPPASPAPSLVAPPPRAVPSAPAARSDAPAARDGDVQVVPPPPRADALRFSFAIEARGEVTTAVVSGALPLVAAAVEARAHLGGAPSWLSPAIAIGMRQSSPKRIGIEAGAADFSWTAATIRLCPVRFSAFAARFEASPCAELDLGTLAADGHGVSDARTSSSLWLDRGASLRASYLLSPSWAIGAGILLTAPMTRHRYALSTGELISKAPGAGTTAGIHLELRL